MIRLAASIGLITLSATSVLAETFSGEVWADNWFEMRIDAERVAQDSVPITTERSFNAERFALSVATLTA